MSLWKRVFIGLCLGIIVGMLLGEKAAVFQPLGTIFINLILMVVIPLIFFVLVNGIVNIENTANFKRIGVKSIFAFLGTAMFAVILGIVITTILKPGIGAHLHLAKGISLPNIPIHNNNVIGILTNIVPSNALKSMVEGNVLHVILFAFFVGFTLNSMGEDCKKLRKLIQETAQLMIKMIETVVKIAPFGVFGYMAWVIGTHGIEILLSMAKLIMTIFLCCIIQYILFGVLIFIFAKLAPRPFYSKMIGTQLLAFSTSSSKATLTTLMRVAHEKLGISKTNVDILIPLSSALNMDGGALYLGSCVIFFAQAMGLTLGIQDYFIIIFTCTLGSIGAAGIPSGILLFLGMALASVGLPIEAVAVVAGVDRILDMATTMINVTGDACVTLIIDKSEGTLDINTYKNLQVTKKILPISAPS